MRTFTLHTADVTGRQTNSLYPNRHQITSNKDLVTAAAFDHVTATYKNNHRSNENFLVSDCVVMGYRQRPHRKPRRMDHARFVV